MKLLRRLLIALYPSWWRRRYGQELDALLEDMPPRPRDVLNVAIGAMTMRLTMIGAFPVAGLLIGALAGGFVVTRTPSVYASSATMRVAGADSTVGDVDLRETLEAALEGTSAATRGATTVELLRRGSSRNTLRLTFVASDPSDARLGAERLTNAILLRANGERASAELLTAPLVPTAPVAPNYAPKVAFGAVAGLATGLLGSAALWRRRRASKEV